MHRTPIDRRAAMFARLLISCGATSWYNPWRERKAIWIEPCEMMVMGEDGVPHGVVISIVAATVYPSNFGIPVPPITAIWTLPLKS